MNEIIKVAISIDINDMAVYINDLMEKDSRLFIYNKLPIPTQLIGPLVNIERINEIHLL